MSSPSADGPSIDDLLGPRHGRFFGDGYRRTAPRLRVLRVDHRPTESTLSGSAGVHVSHAWSVKDGRQQRPHLATTDVLALTAQCVGALLASRFDPATAARSLVTDVQLVAGNEPHEENLEEFPLVAELRVASERESSVTFTAHVGSMTATGTLTRPPAVPSMANLAASASETLALCRGPYGTALPARSLNLVSVRTDGSAARVMSLLACSAHGSSEHVGLEAAFQPAYTLVDVFVATLQLGQVLLYDLDSISRGSSSTLWMRTTRLQTTGPLEIGTGPIEIDVALQRARLITKDDATWRLADIVGHLGPYRSRASVAHQIPSPAR